MSASNKLTIKQRILIFFTKIIFYVLRCLGKQGSTTPGSFLYKRDSSLLAKLAKKQKLILVSGTNGKTSTTLFIVNLLKSQNIKVASNFSGANLRSGLLTTLALNAGKVDVMVLEIDEAVLIAELINLAPDVLLFTNLFRDQLDRYGEINTLYSNINKVLAQTKIPLLILNTDDPLVASFSQQNTIFFGENDNNKAREIQDSVFSNTLNQMLCPTCHHHLVYSNHTISHLGNYFCEGCGYSRNEADYSFEYAQKFLRITKGKISELLTGKKISSVVAHPQINGLYNAYNFTGAVAAVDSFLQMYNKELNLDKGQADFSSLVKEISNFQPAFGRLEKIALENKKNICFLLVKNPAGYVQSLELLKEVDDLGALVLGLNANPQDGKDVSWIWDIPLENYFSPTSELANYPANFIGERALDLALRYSYAWQESNNFNIHTEAVLAVEELMAKIDENKTIYLLLNYTCMLDTRKKLAKKYGFSHFWK